MRPFQRIATRKTQESNVKQVPRTSLPDGGLPDTSGWTASQKDFSLYVFTSLVGKYKKIRDFDELGLAELSFRLKQGETWEYHTVWLEPYLLRLRQRR